MYDISSHLLRVHVPYAQTDPGLSEVIIILAESIRFDGCENDKKKEKGRSKDDSCVLTRTRDLDKISLLTTRGLGV